MNVRQEKGGKPKAAMNGQYKIGDVVLHNWTLTELLGEGSYGKVYKAAKRDISGEYLAAIKILTVPKTEEEKRSAFSEGMTESSASDYFRSVADEMSREFKLMEKLKGESVIVSYEDHEVVQHSDGIGWDIIIRMELLTPFSRILEEKKLSETEIIEFGIDLCHALELCRKHKIIHRDIKPANIFQSQNGRYKLGDFGVARTFDKATGGVTKAGTYNYMAPEVYLEKPYGASVDIYSLGIVLYQLLNNNRGPFLPPLPNPITKTDREKALTKRMGGEKIPLPANNGGRLAEIALKACSYAPQDRYSDPGQMRRDLELLLPVNEPPAPPQLSDEITIKKSSKHLPEPTPEPPKKRIPAILVSLVVLVAAVTGTVAWLKHRPIPPELPPVTTSPSSPTTSPIPVTPPASSPTTSPALASPSASTPTTSPTSVCNTPTPTPFHSPSPSPGSSLAYTPISSPSPSPTPSPSPSPVTSLDIISFGKYEQNSNGSDGRENIDWIVLERQPDKIRIMSLYAIECMPYSTVSQKEWEETSLHSWLNRNFKTTSFTKTEAELIVNDENGDSVSLLTQAEIEAYFPSASDRICSVTPTAKAGGAYLDKNGNCWYWTRTTARDADHVVVMKSDGTFSAEGQKASSSDICVRPTLWMKVQ